MAGTAESPVVESRLRFDPTLLLSLSAAACWWAAFPPLAIRPVAWFCPVLWSLLLQRSIGSGDGRRWPFWLNIWIGGYIGWLGLLDWMCFPIWWAVVAWIGISAILGGFLVAFIAIARMMARQRIPLPLSMALSWTAIEWIRRTWLIGGIPFAALEHSQYPFVPIIQFADIAGDYGLGSLMVFMGGLVGQVIYGPPPESRGRIWVSHVKRTAFGVALISVLISYGHWKNVESPSAVASDVSRCEFALLQSATKLSVMPGAMDHQRVFEECMALTERCPNDVDLIVWPESTCQLGWADIHEGYVPAELRDLPGGQTEQLLQDAQTAFDRPLLQMASKVDSAMLLSLWVRDFSAERESDRHTPTNSAVLVIPEEGICARYDKQNLAPFLECDPSQYVCGRDLLFPSSARFGKRNQAVAFVVSDQSTEDGAGCVAAVNICFESFFPETVRRQVAALRDEGLDADVLINISNDADSSRRKGIDMHFASHVFRAVENRIPCLVASNCGAAAWIDNRGRILAKGQPGTSDVIVATVGQNSEPSPYSRFGDSWPRSCVTITVIMLVLRMFRRGDMRRQDNA